MRLTATPIVTLLVACWGTITTTTAHADTLKATHLECEYRVDPVGIDVLQPRLSWIVTAQERGQNQTAYRILVASSLEKLKADEADLWDSGRVNSDETIQIACGGKPLQTRMQCFWKVKVWDKNGVASGWSPAACWSMGLLKPGDWQAQWIAAPIDRPSLPAVTPHNGYHSGLALSADITKWIQIDLEQARQINGVRLYPAKPFDWNETPGFLFPVRFKIEIAEKADFSDARVVINHTDADVPNPGEQAPTFRFPPQSARWVRMTVTRLGHRDGTNFGFALAELQVLSGTTNVAQKVTVTALDSIESAASGWSKANLVDDRLLPESGISAEGLRPATMLRKDFRIEGPIQRATVSVTGLGLYELRLNGRKVGDQLLAPEWTRYSKRIQYQTWDVTDQVAVGQNTFGAQLADGWWAGPLMLKQTLVGARLCLLLRMDIEFANGRTQTIVTDPTWQATTDGPIRRSGIYFGETYDATREMPGWDQPGFDTTGWQAAEAIQHPLGIDLPVLVAQCNEPIRVMKELRPVKLTEPNPGTFVFDMGQNMVGWCRLQVDGPAGTRVSVRYAERLTDDGTIYTANLRGAAQVHEYTLRGGPAVVEPHFTYYGFRYVEVTGLPRRPTLDTLLGLVFHSAASDTGKFACSNELINRIMHCAEWSQRGNMHSVPTDCPQRTEREGWMGDIQAFSQAAIFNMDMAGFLTKWVRDIRDSQADDGRFPDIAPHIGDPNRGFSGVPAWGDAGTIVPWRVYQNYADVRMLEQHFESAVRWVEYIRTHNPDLLWQQDRGNDYGDWLNADTLALKDFPRGINAIPKDVFATAFFAHSTEIVAKMAHVLERTEEAAKYDRLFTDIKAAFNRAYVKPDGSILGDTQAGYALALHFNLLPEPLQPKATERLLKAIDRYKGHPSTGIQSTHRMMLELTRNGHHEEAYQLLNLRTVPSWGYMIEMGATTIWERWDGYVAGRGFQDPFMNSFNHWAFGSVGEWVWRNLAGINLDESRPGYKHFTLRPRPVSDLTWVKSTYQSIRGPIISSWKVTDRQFDLIVEIPANTTATVYLPADSPNAVTEGGVPAHHASGVRFSRMEEGAAVFELESGRYAFHSQIPVTATTP